VSVVPVLAVAGLLAGPAASSPQLPGGAGELALSADEIRRDADGRVSLDGSVVVRRGLVTLRARSARVDPATGEVNATGDVLLTDATRVVAAEGVHAVMGGPFEAEGVTAFVKDGAVELGGATSIEEARRTGRNRLSFRGARLAGDAAGRLTLDDARLTLCDCGGAAPSWEIRARQADVIPGRRAILSWPVIYVTPRFLLVKRPVPVLVLPWLFLPLGDRQTGLLLPVVASTGATGLGVAEPVFVTLGPSADATLTLEWLRGPGADVVAEERPAVRGAGARLELRWAPAVDAGGRAEVAWVNDLDRERGGAGGQRLSIVAAHEAPLGAATRLRLDLGLTSDPVWWRDFTSDILLRSAFYRRSELLVSHRSDALVVEADTAYYQPLAPARWDRLIPAAPSTFTGLGPLDRTPSSYGTFGADVPVFHRWPALAATLLPEELGPVAVSGRVGLGRFAPASGEASALALGPGDPGFRSGVYVTEREAATRLDGRLELRAPLLVGDAVTVEPYLRGAAVGYAFEAARDPAAVAWVVGGAAVSTELSRSFGALTHRILPSLELRAGTAAAVRGGDPLDLPAYDAWDRVSDRGVLEVPLAPRDPQSLLTLLRPARTLSAAPSGAFRQLRVAVASRLAQGGVDRLRGELGQDLDLRTGRLAETFFSAGALAGPFAADVSGRVLAFRGRAEAAPAPVHASWLDPFTELRAGVSVANRRGDALRAALLAVGAGGSGALMAGVDPLFDLRAASVDAVAQGAVGARFVLGAATMGYDALLPARTTDVPQCGAGAASGGTRTVQGWQVQQHVGSLAWDSPCRCFLARVVVRVTDCGTVSYGASIDLSRLGDRAQFR
jgi:LPS-assembly protein